MKSNYEQPNPYFFDSEVLDEKQQFELEHQDQRLDHFEKAWSGKIRPQDDESIA